MMSAQIRLLPTYEQDQVPNLVINSEKLNKAGVYAPASVNIL